MDKHDYSTDAEYLLNDNENRRKDVHELEAKLADAERSEISE
jgi:hypothetical protein